MRMRQAKSPAQFHSINLLQAQCLPCDVALSPLDGIWWLVTDGAISVGYIGLTSVESWPGSAYIARLGVIHKYRGRGIQRHMMRVAERRARADGVERIISTTFHNPASANNFIKCGYLTYNPTTHWGADGTIYWVKNL